MDVAHDRRAQSFSSRLVPILGTDCAEFQSCHEKKVLFQFGGQCFVYIGSGLPGAEHDTSGAKNKK